MKFNFDLENRQCTKEESTLIKILACLYVDENKDKVSDPQKLFELAIDLIRDGFLAAQLIAEQSDDWRKNLNESLRQFNDGYQEYKKTKPDVNVSMNNNFKA